MICGVFFFTQKGYVHNYIRKICNFRKQKGYSGKKSSVLTVFKKAFVKT